MKSAIMVEMGNERACLNNYWIKEITIWRKNFEAGYSIFQNQFITTMKNFQILNIWANEHGYLIPLYFQKEIELSENTYRPDRIFWKSAAGDFHTRLGFSGKSLIIRRIIPNYKELSKQTNSLQIRRRFLELNEKNWLDISWKVLRKWHAAVIKTSYWKPAAMLISSSENSGWMG